MQIFVKDRKFYASLASLACVIALQNLVAYSVNMLEKQLGVSKYRLCREFHEVYSLSPIQYLNRRRIEMAEHFLLTTDHKVHVIGAMVGIENTNHFITLFKKFTGTTPQEYRQNKLL